MNAARYATGQTFEQFLHGTQKYKELWESTAKRVHVPASLVSAVEGAGGAWHVVVLSEDWCIDAVSTLPPVAELAELAEGVDLRVFGRDGNPDLMNAHLTNGGRSIPIAIVYDDQWIERGWWGPRPSPLQVWVLTEGITLARPEMYREIRTWYARDQGQTTLQEIAELFAGAATARDRAAL